MTDESKHTADQKPDEFEAALLDVLAGYFADQRLEHDTPLPAGAARKASQRVMAALDRLRAIYDAARKDHGVTQDALNCLAISSLCLEMEAEAHRGRGDVWSAKSCELQAAQNRDAWAKATDAMAATVNARGRR